MGKNKKGSQKDTNQTLEEDKEDEDRDAILKELHDESNS